jgi:hypothetical protein
VKAAAELNRPQVRTPDGFVLRRTGGYNICEIALVSSHFEARPADLAANLL